MTKNKLAIVLSGGGMVCSYSAGAVAALALEHGIKNPDLVIAASGSAGTGSYFVSRQYDSILNIWSNLLSTKKFINPLRFWKIIDINYLIDEVFKNQDPLDLDKIYSSSIEYLIPAVNYETGEIEYFSNRKKDDVFEAMRAAKAMPLAFGKSVKIKKGRYGDAPFSSRPEAHVLKAIEMGADRIILIDMSGGDLLVNLGFQIWSLLRKKNFRTNAENYKKAMRNFKIPDSVKVFQIAPKNRLKIGTLNNADALLKETVNFGYQDCKNNIDLVDFLK